ncbi:MAG: cell wall hydrolase [bacterium]
MSENSTKFPSEVTENFVYDFEIAEGGLYLIEIIASAKSWWQNLKSLRAFFNDGDLAVKIDGAEFSKLNGKGRLFDGEAAWNGNNLKGLKKTNIFVIQFSSGKHKIEFIADQSPHLESIKIEKAPDANIVKYIPDKNNPAQDGNNRQWINLVFTELPLGKLSITAKAEKREKDSDDIKLIVDGEIQQNPDSKKFKNWYWCGSLDGSKEKEFNKKVDLAKGLHYIELWADRMPTIEKVEIVLNQIEEPQKRIPTVNAPEWTGDFNDDTEQMILARAIFGEARSLSEQGRIAIGWVIKNRISDSRWADNYHGVILKPKHFSAFNKGDENFDFVKNPFIDKTQIDEWYECYEIAGKLMRNEFIDPTEGANHYFSNFIPAPYWTKKKNVEFKIQIGNTLFYDVKNENNQKGFLKIIICIETLLLIIIAGMGYLWFLRDNLDYSVREIIKDEEAPAYKHFFVNPQNNSDIEVIYLDKDGNIKEGQTKYGSYHSRSQLNIFPNSEMFGYFEYLNRNDEIFNFNDDYEKHKYYDNYIALIIRKNEFADPIEVYRGDVHTSSWEWSDNNHVIVYYGCGTECLYAYKINIETKKIESEYHVYGGDENGKK